MSSRGGKRGTIPRLSKRLLGFPPPSRGSQGVQSAIGSMGVDEEDEGMEDDKESQWLNMDVRNLDADVLGQSVSPA